MGEFRTEQNPLLETSKSARDRNASVVAVVAVPMTASRRVVVAGAPRVARPGLLLPLLLLLLLPAAAVAQPPPAAGLQALERLVVGRAAPGCRGPFALAEGPGEGGSTDPTTYRRCLAWAGGFWCPAPAPGPAGFAWRPCEAADGSALVGAGGPDGPDGLPGGVTWPAAGLRDCRRWRPAGIPLPRKGNGPPGDR